MSSQSNLIRFCTKKWYNDWQNSFLDEVASIDDSIAVQNSSGGYIKLPDGLLFLSDRKILIEDIRAVRPESVSTISSFRPEMAAVKLGGEPASIPDYDEAACIIKLFNNELKKYSSNYAVTYLDSDGSYNVIHDIDGDHTHVLTRIRYDAFIIPVIRESSSIHVYAAHGLQLENERENQILDMLRIMEKNGIITLTGGKYEFIDGKYKEFYDLVKAGSVYMEDCIMMIDKKELLNRDNVRCGLTPYDENILSDSNRGHWELWDPEKFDGTVDTINLGNELIYARNPACDINNNSIVAIDFGTKSTVAVILDEKSNFRPIRIGTGDYSYQSANRYENPTVIQFSDFKSFMESYNEQDGRPFTKFNDISVSHNAYNALSTAANSNYKNFVSRIKQYAGGHYDMRKSDSKNTDIKIKPYLELQEGDTDVIEIYAYYIGLYINNMYRKIFLNYALTMPVNYEEEVRTRIKKSFEKGLKKSLPPALLKNEEAMKKFNVAVNCNESASYAVTALTEFGFEPEDDEKAFYGVFDFGGGTTDFDFGYWRGANNKERRYDYVITYYDDEGDKTLGGENILDIIAYTVWCDNIKEMREKNIPINIPDDCTVVPDCEMLICSGEKSGVRSPSDESSFNNWKLAESLRWIWEETPNPDEIDYESESDTKAIDIEKLLSAVKKRITEALDNIFSQKNMHLSKEHVELLVYDMEKSLRQKDSITESEIIEIFTALLDISEQDSKKVLQFMTGPSGTDIYKHKERSSGKYEYSPDLFDISGNSVNSLKIKVDVEHLRSVIEKRIEKGVTNFFNCLRKNANRYISEENVDELKVNIFLAGNSCKSSIVEKLFNKHIYEQLKQINDNQEKKQYYALFFPLGTPKANAQIAERGVHRSGSDIAPDCKTGVAYGLLLTRNGGRIKVVDKRKVKTIFNYYIGYEKRKKFIHITDKAISFNSWYEFVDASEDTFELFYTTYPEASNDDMPITSAKKIVCRLDKVDEEAMVYYRPVSANEIEYVAAYTDNDGKIEESDMLTKPVRVFLE